MKLVYVFLLTVHRGSHSLSSKEKRPSPPAPVLRTGSMDQYGDWGLLNVITKVRPLFHRNSIWKWSFTGSVLNFGTVGLRFCSCCRTVDLSIYDNVVRHLTVCYCFFDKKKSEIKVQLVSLIGTKEGFKEVQV